MEEESKRIDSDPFVKARIDEKGRQYVELNNLVSDRKLRGSHQGNDDFASEFANLFSAPDLEQAEVDIEDVEVDEYYNLLVSRHNFRSYFDRAQSTLSRSPNEEAQSPEVTKSADDVSLNYIVPGKARLARAKARELYRHASRVVEARQKVKLAFWILAEQHRKTIRETLRRVSARDVVAGERSPKGAQR